MASSVSGVDTVIYAEDWVTKLQDRLSEPVRWKDICHVEYTNMRLLNNPYLADFTVQTGARGTPYTFATLAETNETVTYNTFKIVPVVIDRGDLAQSTYMKQMVIAERQALQLNEAIETSLYADYANITSFDNSEIGGSAGSITVSATNVDDIIRNVKRKIRVASGESLLERNGAFIIWRPADLEKLEGFMQANGFVTADRALGQANPTGSGFDYMGVTHYSSNLLPRDHLIAGIKKVYHLGILKDTYGQIVVDDKDPNLISGISVVSRVDYGIKAWNNTKTVLFNITVA